MSQATEPASPTSPAPASPARSLLQRLSTVGRSTLQRIPDTAPTDTDEADSDFLQITEEKAEQARPRTLCTHASDAPRLAISRP